MLYFYTTPVRQCQHPFAIKKIGVWVCFDYLRFSLFYADLLKINFQFSGRVILDRINAFTSVVRKGVDDYRMISDGDRVAVGISGGKDSLVLLCALAQLRRYYSHPFELEAVTIELGYSEMDFAPVAELCRRLNVPYTRVKTDISHVVFDVRQEVNPCSLCSKMRRGALDNALKARGCNKLALGHHMDDAVETFVMSLLFEGRISCFKPVTYLSRADVTQIRPMIYAGEQRIANLAQEMGLPIVKNACPADRDSKRSEIKQLLKDAETDYPDVKSKIFGAMQRLPIEGWGVGDAAVVVQR